LPTEVNTLRFDDYISPDDRSRTDYFNARRIINPGEIRVR
jgi:hypothetical protein